MSKMTSAPLDRITTEVKKLIDRVNTLLSENEDLKREVMALKSAKPYPLTPARDWLVARGDSEWYQEINYEWRSAISSGVAVRQYRWTLPTSSPRVVEIPDEIIDRLAYLTGRPLNDLVYLANMIDNPD